MTMHRWFLAIFLGTALALGGALLVVAPARAIPADGTFQIAMTGQVASSQVQGTDNQGNQTIVVALELQTNPAYYPAVMLQCDITEHVGAKGTGTLTGTARLADLQQRATIFTSVARGTITTECHRTGDADPPHRPSP
jgi:hypothetical protein